MLRMTCQKSDFTDPFNTLDLLDYDIFKSVITSDTAEYLADDNRVRDEKVLGWLLSDVKEKLINSGRTFYVAPDEDKKLINDLIISTWKEKAPVYSHRS